MLSENAIPEHDIYQASGGEKYPIGYSFAYECVLKKIKKLIFFLNKKDPEAIIIIQSENGIAYGLSEKEKQIELSKNFNLLKLNKNCKSLDLSGKLDIVNNIRLSLTCATNQEVKLLKKKTYLSYPQEHNNNGKVFLLENIDSNNLCKIYRRKLFDFIRQVF